MLRPIHPAGREIEAFACRTIARTGPQTEVPLTTGNLVRLMRASAQAKTLRHEPTVLGTAVEDAGGESLRRARA